VLFGMLLIDVALRVTEVLHKRWVRAHPDPDVGGGTVPDPEVRER
jgi:hypothetical protein